MLRVEPSNCRRAIVFGAIRDILFCIIALYILYILYYLCVFVFGNLNEGISRINEQKKIDRKYIIYI